MTPDAADAARVCCAGAGDRPACGWQGLTAVARVRVEAGVTVVSYHCRRCGGPAVLMLPAVAP